MALTLYYHPLSSYCHKVLVALYEAGVPFTPRHVNLGDAADRATLTALWPMCKFPVLQDEARTVAESSIVIEYLAQHFPSAAALLPADTDTRLQVRLWDRVCDQYVHQPMQKIVGDRLRPAGEQDARGVADARALIQQAYAMLDRQLDGRTWLASEGFSLADCAASPALFYAAILEPVPPAHAQLRAYCERLLARPSVARTVQEAGPWFQYFPFKELLPARFLPAAA
ncbi:glutathione S-transferase family protein [Pseudorhodoferax sp. Leaf267]|uniref:glutathione S-transferase family protein n=1 Tax=Pseudorhodoferax sp. Leaf267 TaxID=1736316 RepID=UPI0006F81DD5|nr:glutathione S-transferase family protein [Pseudorhodoferax sp. Leaf267]KQP11831.1 glutathione S-transferase [Pseudorhodoferax sp. Leaf267]